MLKKPLPAITVERTRNSRRVITGLSVSAVTGLVVMGLTMIDPFLHQVGSPVHRPDNARVRRTAAQIAIHVRDDLLAGRVGIGGKQCRSLHDLAGLAVGAL